MKKRPIPEHFKTSPLLTPELRTLLLDKFDGNTLQCGSLSNAIFNGFVWDETHEGHYFWGEIHDMTKDNEERKSA